jgi:hypothetical protein
LLDVGLGWSRDQLVEDALRVFKHEFDNFWGTAHGTNFPHGASVACRRQSAHRRSGPDRWLIAARNCTICAPFGVILASGSACSTPALRRTSRSAILNSSAIGVASSHH